MAKDEMDKVVDLEIHDGIAEVWLNRPKSLNALSSKMYDQLDEALQAVAAARARVLILAGRGPRAFSAGADITEFVHVNSTVEARASRYRRDAYARLEALPVPTIAAIHGYALGGGAELALCCDIRIAAKDAVFGFPETGLGTYPGAGGTQRLPRTIGHSNALWLVTSGQFIDAEKALQIGMVNRVVAADALMERVRVLGATIATKAPLGIRYAKECILRGLKLPPCEAMKVETDLNMFMDTTLDYAEGTKGFAEKRKPVFVGR
jgi:enoyl-CoA hydratase